MPFPFVPSGHFPTLWGITHLAELSQLDRSLPAASRTYCAVSAVLRVFLVDVRGFLGFFACTGGAETDFSTVV